MHEFEQLRPGHILMFTDLLADFCEAQGIPHDLQYGDTLVAIAIDEMRELPVLVRSQDNPQWRAEISLQEAERAHYFFLRQEELQQRGEGVSCENIVYRLFVKVPDGISEEDWRAHYPHWLSAEPKKIYKAQHEWHFYDLRI